MSLLSDRSIALRWPEWLGGSGPASIDLALGKEMQRWPSGLIRNPRTDQSDAWVPEPLMGGRDGSEPAWLLYPGSRYLAATAETVALPSDVAGLIAARSSWGRDGLQVICGPAGFIDPGFRGQIVLELSVVGSPLWVWPGDRVCQLVLFEMTTPAMRPYAGKYQDQQGIVSSRLHLEHVRAEVVS